MSNQNWFTDPNRVSVIREIVENNLPEVIDGYIRALTRIAERAELLGDDEEQERLVSLQ